MYEIVGDLSEPSYFRVDNDGNIFVKQALKPDIEVEYVVSFHVINFILSTWYQVSL